VLVAMKEVCICVCMFVHIYKSVLVGVAGWMGGYVCMWLGGWVGMNVCLFVSMYDIPIYMCGYV